MAFECTWMGVNGGTSSTCTYSSTVHLKVIFSMSTSNKAGLILCLLIKVKQCLIINEIRA